MNKNLELARSRERKSFLNRYGNRIEKSASVRRYSHDAAVASVGRFYDVHEPNAQPVNLRA